MTKKCFVTIIIDKTKTIMHSQKSLLFGGTDVWMKKDGDKDFAVTLASSDTLCILHKVGEIYRKGRIS